MHPRRWAFRLIILLIAASPYARAEDGGAASPIASPASSATAPDAPPTSPDDAKPSPPKVPMAGYGWSDDKPAPKTAAPAPTRARPLPHRSGPGVVRPGFEMLADGSSRLFVELSQAVPVDEKRGKHELTYVLKGAHIEKRNNYNPLVTMHFNSAATRARLVPHGKDLWFVIDLRADVTPTWKLAPAKDGMQILQIELPKGDYLPKTPPPKGDSSKGDAPKGEPSKGSDDKDGEPAGG